MMDTRDELLPCPFCGSDTIRDHYIRDGRAINCAGCDATINAFHPDALAKASKRWNTRAVNAYPALVEALEGVLAFFAEPNEDSFSKFERLADAFRDETGYLRPGKDSRLDDDDEREAAWEKWVDGKIAAARAALALSARGDGS